MKALFAAVLVLGLFGSPAAFAQDPLTPVVAAENSEGTAPVEVVNDTVVVSDNQAVRLPFGEWIVAALDLAETLLWPAILAGVLWLGTKLPKPFQNIYRTFMTEQLLKRAVDFGINATKGAVQGKTVDVKVGNSVIAAALDYAVKYGSQALIDWNDGREGLKDKIIARVPVDQNAAIKK